MEKNKINFITGETYTLAELFSGNRRIVIPDLQRDYCWGDETNIKATGEVGDLVFDFVNNLVEQYEAHEQGTLNLGLFYSGNYEELADEISEIKHAARGARLKVILETGALKTAADIKKASILAMYSGADFIKTSTGKVYPGATLEAAYVMCQCIKEYHEKTGTMIGFKVSGGVSSTEDAVKYYTLVKEILGEQWLNNNYFRIGTSRAANYILSSIIGKETKFF